ncbi:MAG: UDP-N-acetylmuramoyl-L-alanine--D-glutamate ligase [Gammaproteobacteria bacterium]|nr:UDP-N-acetylmuramoyl-L-alanine--D-glutamate ligase [Gammaproteobacteria bacterium]
MALALQEQMMEDAHECIVVGLGKTGLSVARHLHRRGISFAMTDTRDQPPGLAAFRREFPHLDICTGALPAQWFAAANQIVLSPGVDTRNPAIQAAIARGAECLGDVELFASANRVPVVAVTGSNGKSTVVQLVTEMASACGLCAYAGGNIGTPVLDLLEKDDAQLFVLELSSFQLESTWSLKPRIGAVLNVSADHLDRHDSLEQYAEIKARIYAHASCSVVNRDDGFVMKMKTSGMVTDFGLGRPADRGFGLLQRGMHSYLAQGDHCLLSTDSLKMQGEAGILNALAALAIGHAFGLSMENMCSVLKRFKGLPHRLSQVGESRGVAWFNDSKGTNVGASVMSLRSLESNVILLAGGIFKGGDLAGLRSAVARHAKHAILFGQDSDLLRQALRGAVQIHSADTMRDAVVQAQALSVAGDKVLLSPACASFDMYENYIARGRDFESCVRELVL